MMKWNVILRKLMDDVQAVDGGAVGGFLVAACFACTAAEGNLQW